MKNAHWMLEEWLLLLVVAFICSAVLQLVSNLPPSVLGFAFAAFLVKGFRKGFDSLKGLNRFVKLLAILLMVAAPIILIIFSAAAGTVDLANPYLSGGSKIGRAAISGVGGIIFTLIMLGAAKIRYSRSQDMDEYDAQKKAKSDN